LLWSHSDRRFSAVFAGLKGSEKPFKRFTGLVTYEITGLKPRCE
jgi:hypothetical protein